MTCVAVPRDHHRVRVRRTALATSLYTPQSPLPAFEQSLPPPDLSRWLTGNDGIPGVITQRSGHAGPTVVIVSLVHGNEYAGATALDRLLRSGLTPPVGTLSVIFANLAAFARFDPENPVASRFVDEDLNRVWSAERLHSNAQSCELDRARELAPLIERADILLDLHSMLWDSEPLLLAPNTESSLTFAAALADPDGPDLIVTDLGHRGGNRLIEHPRFTTHGGGCACLLEAGGHWQRRTADTAEAVTMKALEFAWGQRPARRVMLRRAIVTDNVVAQSANFAFTESYRGGAFIRHGGTIIAQDGPDDICTPYDDCLLIMPNHRPARGHMAVRLARLI